MGTYVTRLSGVRDPQVAGTKAYNLRLLQKWGFRIPQTFVCVTKAYEDYLAGKADVSALVASELGHFVDKDSSYAVRSSTNVEDGTRHSFAGQFNTYLDVGYPDGLIEAIRRIWTIKEESIQTYAERTGATLDQVKPGILIQRMVKADASGVVFSHNPLTGSSECVVELVRGQGIALVQKGVTPGRFVQRSGKWLELSSEHMNYLEIVEAIALHARRAAVRYGKPVDLEWVFDGKDIYWLQLRQITGLNAVDVYSNRISKEILPGMIKPLVWSVNTPMVNSAWKRIFREMIGKDADCIDIHRLARPIYYRAYFNMGVIGSLFESLGMPRDSLEAMIGMRKAVTGPRKMGMSLGWKALRRLPRLVVFLFSMIGFSKRSEAFYSTRRRELLGLLDADFHSMGERKLLDTLRAIARMNEETSYYTVICQLLAAASSGMLRLSLGKTGSDTTIAVSSDPAVVREISLAGNLDALAQAWASLPESRRQQIHRRWTGGIAEIGDHEDDFDRRLGDFFRLFGHHSDSSVDLSRKTWREDPDMVLRIIGSYQPPARFEPGKALSQIEKLQISPWRKAVIRRLFRRAVAYLNTREKITYLYNLGYGLLRPRFQSLARLLMQRGMIRDEEDIHYYAFDEIDIMVGSEELPERYRHLCLHRKAEMEALRDVILPETVFGESLPPILKSSARFDSVVGTPVSGGYAEGPARLVMSSEDFHKVEANDILIIPFSDVSWTPLFARAKAIVSESGGFLSHCAIVAREFGIPAVVAVGEVRDIRDGETVSVNGFTGEIKKETLPHGGGTPGSYESNTQ